MALFRLAFGDSDRFSRRSHACRGLRRSRSGAGGAPAGSRRAGARIVRVLRREDDGGSRIRRAADASSARRANAAGRRSRVRRRRARAGARMARLPVRHDRRPVRSGASIGADPVPARNGRSAPTASPERRRSRVCAGHRGRPRSRSAGRCSSGSATGSANALTGSTPASICRRRPGRPSSRRVPARSRGPRRAAAGAIWSRSTTATACAPCTPTSRRSTSRSGSGLPAEPCSVMWDRRATPPVLICISKSASTARRSIRCGPSSGCLRSTCSPASARDDDAAGRARAARRPRARSASRRTGRPARAPRAAPCSSRTTA